jgi:hypothetical protein
MATMPSSSSQASDAAWRATAEPDRLAGEVRVAIVATCSQCRANREAPCATQVSTLLPIARSLPSGTRERIDMALLEHGATFVMLITACLSE